MIRFDPDRKIPDHLQFVVKRPALRPAGHAWRLRRSLARSLDTLAIITGDLADLVAGQPCGVLLFRTDPAALQRQQEAYGARLAEIALQASRSAE